MPWIRPIAAALISLPLSLTMSQAAEPGRFEGVAITVAVQDASAIGSPAEAHARTWEQRTGGRVDVVRIPFIDLFQESMASISGDTPRFDVLLHASGWTADFFPYLTEVPEWLREQDSFDDIHPTYRERLMTWDGRWIAYTIDGDLFSGYYRTDLFQDPVNQTAFAERYGHRLRPPDTWAEYRDIAEFFTGLHAGDGGGLYGTAEAFARGGQQFWDLFSRASAYTNHPDFPGAQFFDPDTMGAEIDNPGWVRAVEEYADILRFCPPEARDYGIIEARQAFLSGRTAMILDWGDTGQLAAAPDSAVAGKVGYFVLPGSRDVFNAREWRWDRLDLPHKAPFLAFGGWVASVPKNSRHQDAAWDFIAWYASPENSLGDVVRAGSGVNPYRLSHFTHVDAWTEALSPAAAARYLGVIQDSLDSPNAALDLRLPGFHRYTEALETALGPVLSGRQSAATAMHRVAEAWEAITDDLGRERQLAIYRASMGLTGEPDGPRPGPGPGPGAETLVIGFSQATTTEPWRLLFNRELRAEAARHPDVDLLGGPGHACGHVLEIWGGMGSTPARQRHRGFREAIAGERGIEVLGPSRDGDWKQDLGFEIMVEALERYPRIDLVYAHNDPMAYGAYLAAVEAGRAGDIAFIGTDGIPAEGISWVADGILDATFIYEPPGDEAVRAALHWLRDPRPAEPPPRRRLLPTRLIDAGNAATVLAGHDDR